jgi:hypothetical protein
MHKYFCQSNRTAWIFFGMIALHAEAVYSWRYSTFCTSQCTPWLSDGPTGESQECKVRELWWSFHWSLPSNPLLRELFIQPSFDCLAVMSKHTILLEPFWLFTLLTENAWKSFVCQNIRIILSCNCVLEEGWFNYSVLPENTPTCPHKYG